MFSCEQPKLAASNADPNAVRIRANLDLVNQSRIAKGLTPYKTHEELIADLNRSSKSLRYEAVGSNSTPQKTQAA